MTRKQEMGEQFRLVVTHVETACTFYAYREVSTFSIDHSEKISSKELSLPCRAQYIHCKFFFLNSLGLILVREYRIPPKEVKGVGRHFPKIMRKFRPTRRREGCWTT